ncbi:hypothetical protein PG993_011648 [Apiospora rasikravindrae]|uniref:Peptidase S8/S53 domain-containing protein n=1 Tax=Apiospora rasikravindrae TaxID=990691 RepID=A0ABR1S080_9PEZI
MSALQLAIRVTERLQHVVEDVRTPPACMQFCGSLNVVLVDLIKFFRCLPEDEYSEKEAAALLEQLDNLCRMTDGLGQYESLYPAATLLLSDSESATLAIRDIASCQEAQGLRRMILASLEAFVPQKLEGDEEIDRLSFDDTRPYARERPECGEEIRLLHDALFKHCLCADTDEMVTRIRLRSTLGNNRAKVTFGILFMAHPHRTKTGVQPHPWWQDTQFSVYRTGDLGTSPGTGCEEVRLDSEAPFCSYISAQDTAGLMTLKFLVNGRKLYFEESMDPRSYWEFDKSSISLGQLLETLFQTRGTFTEKQKEVLSWILAKSVWQYYSSPWIQQPWNKDSVSFLIDRQHGEDAQVCNVFVDEPLLSVSIAQDSAGGEKRQGQQAVGTKTDVHRRGLSRFSKPLHPVPKILALGVMLVEIQLGRPIESLYGDPQWSHYCPQGKKNQNTDYRICCDLITRRHFFEDMDISDPLELLIRNCIHPNESFIPPQVRDEEGVRDPLYLLVDRLEVYLSERKPNSVKPLSLVGTMPSAKPLWAAQPPQSKFSPPSPEERTTGTPRPGRTMAQISNSTSTKDWFRRMDCLNYILKANKGDAYKPVKIAVLDTGVDPHDAASVYIDGYRDFVSGDDSIKRDNTGHGTTSVNLIFDMCESASVHVARIFEQDEASDNTQELAIQALDWCIKEQMDVVCLACGFASSCQELFAKIHEASGKMLILAAPTNEGNAGEIAYPARYDNDVLCIFSTDGAVTKSQQLNPSGGLGMYNFAILGENIKTMSGEVKSGTSFSTALAAGLVGRLLEFARHSDSKGRITNASLLKVKYGMTKVLLSMAMKDSEFHCLKPWKLLPVSLRNQIPFEEYGFPQPEERETARDYICNLVTMSLADA